MPFILLYPVGGQLTLSQLLPLICKQPRLRDLDIRNLLKILQNHPQIFELVDNRTREQQIYVLLAFELQICEQPRQCRGYPGCKALHICKYFIQNKCRENPDNCLFGHSLHTRQNLPILKEHNLDHIDPMKVKEWMQQQHNYWSRCSRPPQVCTFYNTARGCNKGDHCPFLHLCNYFVKRTCKFGFRCSRSHALLSKRNIEILREHDIDVRSSQDQILDKLNSHSTQDTQFDEVEGNPCATTAPDYTQPHSNMGEEDNMTPGKPFLVEAKKDCIKLQWKGVPQLSSYQEYQIQYKKMFDGRWNIYNQSISHNSTRVSVSGLKAQSLYSFRIRVIDARKGKEYPYSPESSLLETTGSGVHAASLEIKYTHSTKSRLGWGSGGHLNPLNKILPDPRWRPRHPQVDCDAF